MTLTPGGEVSRRTFLKGGGALIVGFSVLGSSIGARAAKAGANPYESDGPVDPQQIDSWVAIHSDNTASIKLGMIELGQGSTTGLLTIAAEELNMAMSQMKMIANDTDITPNQGFTAGSQAVAVGGKQVRAAAAAAAQALRDMAAGRLGVNATSLAVDKGVVSGGGKTVSYGDLVGDKLFNLTIPAGYNLQSVPSFFGGPAGIGPGLAPGAPGTKAVGDYKIVGKEDGPQRIDIPAKVSGKYTYVHSVRVPGMLHGRIIRPRGQGAYGDGTAPAILSVDATSIKHLPNVKVVRSGNFLGVVAPQEYDAIQASAQLKVKWAAPPELPGNGNLFGQMRSQDAAGKAKQVPYSGLGNVDSAMATAATTLSQSYRFAYNGHLPIGPSCAVADVTPGGARVLCNSQDCYGTRGGVQAALKMAGLNLPENRVRITYVEGSSVFGSSPQNDVAQSAAVLSYLAGAPVRLQFMRWDEHGWDNYGPAQLMDVRAGVDASGKLVATDFTHYSIPFYSTEPASQQLGAAPVPLGFDYIEDANLGKQYGVANRRVLLKSLPLLNNYFKSTWLRAPLAPGSLFGYEQMIDELAYATKMDPVAFRLQNMTSNAFEAANGQAFTWNRWKNVLTEVAKISGWKPGVAASALAKGDVVTGRGIALGGFAGTMAAIVADIEVNKKTGKIIVKHLYGAQDTGLTVYPRGAQNQAVGSMTQGASRALHEAVVFDKKGVTSLDWVTYPIMRFKEAPSITFSLVQRMDIPDVDGGSVAANGLKATGSGEPPTAPVAAAIANAFFDATGVRIREAPMTPGRVRAVLAAA